MSRPDALKILPSDGSYKTFCELVNGYRMLCVAMQAVESGVIEAVGTEGCTAQRLLEAVCMKEEEGRRFLFLLLNLGILESYDNYLHLSRFARRYLLRESELSQINVLEFEKGMIDRWRGLGGILSEGQGSNVVDQPLEEYGKRLTLFQKAMAEAAVVRSRELWDAVAGLPETGVIIDVGAGDGTYLKEFLRRYPGWRAVACDLADVCALDKSENANTGITWDTCNIAEPKECGDFVARHRQTASVLLLSNFLHCYSESENVAMVGRLKGLLKEEGRIIIHDFFRDGNGFGALYDLHMMVNTYNGRTYTIDETFALLGGVGLDECAIIDLPSFSQAVVAGRQNRDGIKSDPLFLLRRSALSLGFFEAAVVDPAAIRIEPWVRAKCRYGCAFYGRKWSCPPHSLDGDEFRELLASYSRALVVAGQPPLRDFQEKLLELEKSTFLSGFQKALVFSGGPCTWCETCDENRCLFPEKRRPSLESCGCDVFALAELCGITVAPIQKSDDFVQYIGLLLVE